MQVSPMAGTALLELHQNIYGVIKELLVGSEWTAGALYINGAAWVLNMQHPTRGNVDIVADLGDRDTLVLKVQTLI